MLANTHAPTRTSIALVIVTLLAFVLTAEAEVRWRTFSGGFSSRWQTIGHHGHDQPACGEDPQDGPRAASFLEAGGCDAADFARGNLDNSIGFRAGVERDLWRVGALHILGGAETGVSYTEYNLSQRDFALVTGAMFTGAELQFGAVRLGGRYGFGGYSSTDRRHLGDLQFAEVSATLPLRTGAALRISSRHVRLSSRASAPSAVETSVLFVSAPESRWSLPWDLTTASGVTLPGAGLGGDRKLRQTAFNRALAHRALPFGKLDLELSWDATAHESSLSTEFRGYDGNYRSKTIDAYGLGISRIARLSERLALRTAGGVTFADWRDEHQLLTRDGTELRAGIEVGLQATCALRVALDSRLALEAAAQKVYWQRMDLSEARFGFGIVLTR